MSPSKHLDDYKHSSLPIKFVLFSFIVSLHSSNQYVSLLSKISSAMYWFDTPICHFVPHYLACFYALHHLLTEIMSRTLEFNTLINIKKNNDAYTNIWWITLHTSTRPPPQLVWKITVHTTVFSPLVNFFFKLLVCLIPMFLFCVQVYFYVLSNACWKSWSTSSIEPSFLLTVTSSFYRHQLTFFLIYYPVGIYHYDVRLTAT